MKKNYLFYITSFNGGGAESVFIRIANELSDRKNRVLFIVNSESGNLKPALSRNIQVFNLDGANVYSKIIKIRSILLEYEVDRFFSTLNLPNLIGFWASVLAQRKEKHFARVAAVHRESYNHTKNVKRKILLIIMGFHYRFFGNLIAVSEAVKNDLITNYHVPKNKVYKIFNPAKYDYLPSKRKNTKENKTYKILVSGRLVKQKNVDKILRVYRQYLISFPETELVILGDGEERFTLERLACNLSVAEKTKFMGFVSDPSTFFAEASLFILFSSWEGLPNVVIDALSHDIQIIVSNAPGGSDELVGNGAFGCVVENENEKELLETMKTLRKTPFQVNTADKKWFLEKFKIRRIADQYEGEPLFSEEQ